MVTKKKCRGWAFLPCDVVPPYPRHQTSNFHPKSPKPEAFTPSSLRFDSELDRGERRASQRREGVRLGIAFLGQMRGIMA